VNSLFTRLFGEKKKSSAQTAKDRLAIVFALERDTHSDRPNFVHTMQRELLEVISKYFEIGPDDIKIQFERQDNMEILEVNIVLPENTRH
jgi:cell division topological specificity factor